MCKYNYRAKSKDTGKWVFGDLIQHKRGTSIYNQNTGFNDIKLETLDKYIGRCDSKQMPIFEEDYVSLTCVKGNQMRYLIEMVIYDSENCVYIPFFLRKTMRKWDWNVTDITVIGNKHDNPDIKTGWAN